MRGICLVYCTKVTSLFALFFRHSQQNEITTWKSLTKVSLRYLHTWVLHKFIGSSTVGCGSFDLWGTWELSSSGRMLWPFWPPLEMRRWQQPFTTASNTSGTYQSVTCGYFECTSHFWIDHTSNQSHSVVICCWLSLLLLLAYNSTIATFSILCKKSAIVYSTKGKRIVDIDWLIGWLID